MVNDSIQSCAMALRTQRPALVKNKGTHGWHAPTSMEVPQNSSYQKLAPYRFCIIVTFYLEKKKKACHFCQHS